MNALGAGIKLDSKSDQCPLVAFQEPTNSLQLHQAGLIQLILCCSFDF